jgi:sigma-B regulation protein RsbU (phosphoserine phosphatase)
MKSNAEKDVPTILVADDDRTVRMMLRLILQKEGYKVIEAENGEQCMNNYHKEHPDMVLLDAIMPLLDGFSCCKQIKNLPGGDRIPVLMITALEDQKSVDRAFASGAVDYITKPLYPPVLTRRLRRILEATWAEQSLRESEQRYRTVVNNLKEVILQMDREGNISFLNPAWQNITGFTHEDTLGKNFLEFIHPDSRKQHIKQFHNLIQRKFQECHYQLRYLLSNGGFGWMEIYLSSLIIENNYLSGVLATVNDITERKSREQHQKIKYIITAILAKFPDLEIAASKIIQAICGILGWDLGEFWLFDQKADALHLLAVWHLKTKNLQAFQEATEEILFLDKKGEITKELWSKVQPILEVNYPNSQGLERQEFARIFGLKSRVIIPIFSGEEKLGVITFFSRSIKHYPEEEIKNITSLSSEIGHFIKRKQAEENLQHQNLILQSELNQAAEYVRSLLANPLITDYLNINWNFLPSQQLGGDIFDYYWLDSKHLVVYLLDVSGHGLRSALLSVSVLNLLRSQSLYNTDFYQPATVLTELNRVFQMGYNGDDYFTIWYGVYNVEDRQLFYASAGHPPSILVANSSVTKLLTPSLPIGMLPDIYYDERFCQMPADSSLYIFSDGVYEIQQKDGAIWGLENFISFISNNKNNTIDTIFNKINELRIKPKLDDDASLLQISFI